MCIRDRRKARVVLPNWPSEVTVLRQTDEQGAAGTGSTISACLLYTSDAADERSSVDLGGRRIIKKTK